MRTEESNQSVQSGTGHQDASRLDRAEHQRPHEGQTQDRAGRAANRVPGRDTGAPTAPDRSTRQSVRRVDALCDRVRAALEAQLGAAKVRRHLGQGVELSNTETGIEVSAPDRFALDMIERRIGSDLRRIVRELTGREDSGVSFKVSAPSPAAAPAAHQAPARPEHAPTPERVGPKGPACPSLGDFVVGEPNQIAYGAVCATLKAPAASAPIFVHGPCGVGKTHLLRAAAQEYRASVRGSKVRYTTGEAFTNSFVQAVRTKTIPAFERRFRDLDLLCLDDVHMIEGKAKTQDMLLAIFNTLSLSGAKVIIASDAPPSEMHKLNTALSSRFSSGVVTRIDPPDEKLGMELARRRCAARGLRIDERGLRVILDRTGIGRGASVRDLEGAITQVQALVSLMGAPNQSGADLPCVMRAMDLRSTQSAASARTGPIPVNTIVQSVCDELGITREDLSGRGRHPRVVLARELSVHISRELTSASFPEIARAMGRSNHSTVITAHKRFLKRIEEEARVRVCGAEEALDALTERLIGRTRETHKGLKAG